MKCSSGMCRHIKLTFVNVNGLHQAEEVHGNNSAGYGLACLSNLHEAQAAIGSPSSALVDNMLQGWD